MAVEVQTISTQEIKPIFSRGTGSTQALGTAHEDAHTFFDFPIQSYSMPYHSSTLEVAPNYSGHSGQIDTQMRHRQDLSTWTFDVSFFGTVQAILSNCLWAFGDGATAAELTPAIGIGNGAAGSMQMKHGAVSNNHATVIFRNGGTDATAEDLTVRGAVIQSMTIKMDVGSNAGQMTCDSTFWTAYQPTEEANAIASNITIDSSNAVKSIFDLTAAAITLNAEEIVPVSWEITISRSLERVGSQTYATTFLPFAYVQTGAWEVTGSLNVKADDNTYDLTEDGAMPGNSTGFALSIAGSGLTISCPTIMIDNAALDNSGSFLTHTIPFRAFAASTTANIISITIA